MSVVLTPLTTDGPFGIYVTLLKGGGSEGGDSSGPGGGVGKADC